MPTRWFRSQTKDSDHLRDSEAERSRWRQDGSLRSFTSPASMHVFTRVFRYVKRYPAMAAGTLACAICGTLMVVVFPAITQ